MSERDVQGNLLLLTDLIKKKFREEDTKDNPRPLNHAEKLKRDASMKEAELMIEAASALIGGALIDLTRIASALESLALSHLPKPPQ